MKNTLKFLLCTMCCAMVFNNCGYSMQGMNQNFNNNQLLEQMRQNATNEYNKIKNALKNSIKQKTKRAGLQNIGSVCYMNAVLQCIANNPEIASTLLSYYFMTNLNKNNYFNTYVYINKNTTPLTKAYSDVLVNLYNNPKNSFAPSNFKYVLGQLNNLFKNFEAADAKDFILFLLERLHQETNLANPNYVSNFQENQFDKNTMLQYFVHDYFGRNRSVFTDEYYGTQCITSECQNCHNKLYNFQTFDFIEFPLLDVSKYNKNKKPQYDPVSIDDCFKYNQKTELFTGNNKMYCNICKAKFDSSYTTKIYTAPKTLILILNRGKNNQDYYGNCKISENLDIKNYVEQGNSTYYLSGVVVHLGESGQGGHFMAYCRSSENANWYEYNDAFVSLSNFEAIRGRPYILFYTQCEEPNNNNMNNNNINNVMRSNNGNHNWNMNNSNNIRNFNMNNQNMMINNMNRNNSNNNQNNFQNMNWNWKKSK